MKKNRRRFISLCMAMVLLLGMCTHLTGCGSKETQENEVSEAALTKAEWITGLASAFGMTEYTTTEPFFTDMDETSEIFAFVQSSAEWGLFEETGIAFEPDVAATRDFVVKTALIAADVVKATDEEGTLSYEDCITYAVTEGLIIGDEETYLAEAVDPEEAQRILDWAVEAFSNQEIEEYETIVFQDGVVDLTSYTEEVSTVENITTVAASVGITLQVGDTILVPAVAENGTYMAKKIVSVETDGQGNQILTTEEPELGDVFEELSFSKTVVPTDENIILQEGVSLAHAQSDEENLVLTARGGGGAHKKNKGYSRTLKVQYSSEKGIALGTTAKTSNEKLDIMLSESGLSVETQEDIQSKFELSNAKFDAENLEITEDKEKYESGYEITGTVSIKNLYADVTLDTKKFFGVPYKVKELSVALNYDIEQSLELKGEFKGEKTLGTAVIPIIPGIVSLNVDFILYVDANGAIQVRVETGNFVKFSYEDDKVKKTATSTSEQEASLMADVNISAGMSLELATVGICITDFDTKVGVLYSFSTSLENDVTESEDEEKIVRMIEGTWKIKVDYTLPIVTLALGNGQDALLKLGYEWQMIGPNGIIKKVDNKKFLEEEYTLYRKEEVEWLGMAYLDEDIESVLKEFVTAPENARISYENFYSIEGVREFIDRNVFLDKDRLNESQQYIAGTDLAYSEEDRVFGNGRVEKGSMLTLSTQEEERFDNDYSIIYYNENELIRIRTDRVHTDTRDAGIVGNVGGFSDFLREHRCATISDFLDTFGLAGSFREMIAQAEGEYQETFNSKELGTVTIVLECSESWSGDVQTKTLSILFEEGTSSPFKEIYIYEQLANTLTADIPILRIEAYTEAY